MQGTLVLLMMKVPINLRHISAPPDTSSYSCTSFLFISRAKYRFAMSSHMIGQFRSPDYLKSFQTCLTLSPSAMASISSITDITTQAASSQDSVIPNNSLHISISPTMRYSGERGNLSRSFGTAFPLVVHRDLERQIIIVTEEPAFPIRLNHTLYYTLDEPDHWFNFDGQYRVGRWEGCSFPGSGIASERGGGMLNCIAEEGKRHEIGTKGDD
jgi:hypothetical protein